MGIGELNGDDENSGEVEAVEVTSNCSSSDGRGIITLDGKTDPKVQEDNDTASDDFPKKVPTQPTPKKAPKPPNLSPFDTTVLPFFELAPPPDTPMPTALDLPPNCENCEIAYYEEGLPLITCTNYMAGCDECFLPYWPEPPGTIVPGNVEGIYENTVTGSTSFPDTEIGGMLEPDNACLPWSVCITLKECILPVLLTTDLAIFENALPLNLFLKISILADVSEHVQALLRSLIECRVILRRHNIPFAVVPSSVFVDLRRMAVMMPHSFCIMEQTWEEFVFFALEVLDMLESMLNHPHPICEFVRSFISQMLYDSKTDCGAK